MCSGVVLLMTTLRQMLADLAEMSALSGLKRATRSSLCSCPKPAKAILWVALEFGRLDPEPFTARLSETLRSMLLPGSGVLLRWPCLSVWIGWHFGFALAYQAYASHYQFGSALKSCCSFPTGIRGRMNWGVWEKTFDDMASSLRKKTLTNIPSDR